MVKKLFKISLISFLIGSLGLPVVGQETKKSEEKSPDLAVAGQETKESEEKPLEIGSITGRVKTYYFQKDVKYSKDADTQKESGIYSEGRLGWSGSTMIDSLKVGGKAEIDIQEAGSGISKTEDSSSFIVTHRDKYVYLKNETFKLLMGYAWSHLNKGYIAGKYQDGAYAGTQNSLGDYGTRGSRVEAIRFDILAVENAEFGLVYGQSSDGQNNWHTIDDSMKTNDSGYSVHGKYSTGPLQVKGAYYSASSRGDENRDASSDGYELDTTATAFGVKVDFGKMDLIPLSTFVNYQVRTSEDADGKTGSGFTRMEIGVDYSLNETSGLTVVYNTKEEDNEDTDDNEIDETFGFSYARKFSKLVLSAGYSTETHKTKDDSWNKENRLGFAMQYNFK